MLASGNLRVNSYAKSCLQKVSPAPLMIDEDIRTEWNVPPSWKLRAHMNFGAILSPASEKAFMSDEKRFIVAKQP